MNFKKRYVLLLLIFIGVLFAVYGYNKSIPVGLSYEGREHAVYDADFLYDLTYLKDGKRSSEQVIFNNIIKTIEEAEQFIVIDMFLFNDAYDKSVQYPGLTEKLTAALVNKKKENPAIDITFITDEMNSFYDSYSTKYIDQLNASGVHVIYTDLNKLRDSNPTYSGFYRAFVSWIGDFENGWLPNPFSDDSPRVKLKSYAKLLNFKANHRKLVATEKQAIVTSANPHDASGYHSNIAFVVKGRVVEDIVNSENSVAVMSDEKFTPNAVAVMANPGAIGTDGQDVADQVKASFITEGKIKKHILRTLNETGKGDEVKLGMFYLSDRDIIKALLAAANRDVSVQLVLDPNKDAFGMEKNGIPNRPVASELMDKSDGKIKIRWYDTHGEQYHTKLLFVKKAEESVIFGGSSNFTKRNIGDFNLEADVKIVADNDHEIVKEIESYFMRIWENEGGVYTADYEKYQDDSSVKYWVYRFQEWSGLSTF
ncbi:phospholipase D family protein [Schinkia sp. CFF1]